MLINIDLTQIKAKKKKIGERDPQQLCYRAISCGSSEHLKDTTKLARRKYSIRMKQKNLKPVQTQTHARAYFSER